MQKNVRNETFNFLNAVEENDFEKAKECINNGALINAKDFEDESTALHKAVFNKNLEMVKLLINNNADNSIKNKSGQIALLPDYLRG